MSMRILAVLCLLGSFLFFTVDSNDMKDFFGFVPVEEFHSVYDRPVEPDLSSGGYYMTTEPDLEDPDYFPEILKYYADYAPDYLYAEERSWMDDDFEYLASGKSRMDYSPGAWLYTCFDAAYMGNPRGMVCMAEVVGNAYGIDTHTERFFPENPELPKIFFEDDFWHDWAARYMGEEWAYTRRGELFEARGLKWHFFNKISDHSKNRGEAIYLTGDFDTSAKLGSYAGMGSWAQMFARFSFTTEDAHKRGFESLDDMRDYILKSGYACDKGGVRAMSKVYEWGSWGFPKDKMLMDTWLMLLWETEASWNRPRQTREAYLQERGWSGEERHRILKNATLILNQCERQREALRVKERERWIELTREFRREVEPLTQIMRVREQKAWDKVQERRKKR